MNNWPPGNIDYIRKKTLSDISRVCGGKNIVDNSSDDTLYTQLGNIQVQKNISQSPTCSEAVAKANIAYGLSCGTGTSSDSCGNIGGTNMYRPSENLTNAIPTTMNLGARNMACASLNNPQELINIHKGYWTNATHNRGSGVMNSPNERASVTNSSARGMYTALGCRSTLCQISGDGDKVTCALPRGIDPSWHTTNDCGEKCHLELNRLSKILYDSTKSLERNYDLLAKYEGAGNGWNALQHPIKDMFQNINSDNSDSSFDYEDYARLLRNKKSVPYLKAAFRDYLNILNANKQIAFIYDHVQVQVNDWDTKLETVLTTIKDEVESKQQEITNLEEKSQRLTINIKKNDSSIDSLSGNIINIRYALIALILFVILYSVSTNKKVRDIANTL
jgi:hypothetical protein